MVIKAFEPAYKIVGNNTIPKAIKNNTDKIAFVFSSKRPCINSGIVVIPFFIYLGKNQMAVMTIAIAASVSQAITSIPSEKAWPFKPTICSADKFVNNNEPAIVSAPKLLPPRK